MSTQLTDAEQKVARAAAEAPAPVFAAVSLSPRAPARTTLNGVVRLVRPKQWVKNGFVVAPLLFAHEFVHIGSVVATLVAIAYFCVASSAVYILNDLNDRESDRLHPVKRLKRPLAAGTVTIPTAIGMLVGLWIVVATSALWNLQVFGVLAAYSVINIAYSAYLKHQPVIDIFTVASGFVLRVIAGSFAILAPVSSWMCITVLCLALYLAAVKRLQELKGSGSAARASLDRYSVALIQRYGEMSATGALVFYSMYVLTMETHLAITIPVVIFGLFRYWWVVDHEGAGESPTDALLRDWQLLATIAAWAGICAWALWPKA